MSTLPRIANVADTETDSPAAAVGAAVIDRRMQRLSVRANFLWIALGTGGRAGFRFLTFVALIKLAGLEVAGIMVAIMALAGPIFTLAELGLRTSLIHDTQRRYPFQRYFTIRATAVLAAYVVLLATALAVGQSAERVLLLAVFGIGQAFDSLADILHGVLQREERMDYIGQGLLLRKGLELAALVLGVWITGSLLIGLIGLCVCSVAVFLLWDARWAVRVLAYCNERESTADGDLHLVGRCKTAVESRPRERLGLTRFTPEVGKLVLWSLPLGIVALQINLLSTVPRLIVEAVLGPEALAVFGTLVQGGAAGVLLVSAVGTSISPRMSRYYDHFQFHHFMGLLARLLAVVLGLGLAACATIYFFGETLLTWVFQAEVAEYVDVALVLAVAITLAYATSAFGHALNAAKLFKTHMVIRGLAVVFMLTLVPPLTIAGAAESVHAGLQGAAWGVLCTNAIVLPICLSTVGWSWYRRLRRARSLGVVG